MSSALTKKEGMETASALHQRSMKRIGLGVPLNLSEDAVYILLLVLCLIFEMFPTEANPNENRPAHFDAFSKIPCIQHTRRWRIHVGFGASKNRY